jgi:Putative Actinobacterial Holin-X, holin superfamily III
MDTEDMGTDLRDRPMGDLAKQLSGDVSELVRRELDLAKTEMAAKARRAAIGGGLIGAAAILALAVLGSFVAAAIMALDAGLADWLAAVIVGLVIAGVAAAMSLAGLKSLRRATPPVPEDTVDSVKEDVAWVKTRAKSGTR